MNIKHFTYILAIGLACMSGQAALALDRPSPFSGGVEDNAHRNSAADEEGSLLESGLSWGAHIGFTTGGDNLEDLQLGDKSTKVDATGGGAFYLGGGARYDFIDMPLELHLSLALHTDGYVPSTDAKFRRFPLDMLGFYKFNKHRFGGGLTFHFSPKLEVNNEEESSKSESFDNAMGIIFEYGYMVIEGVSLGLRYTSIDYKASDQIEIKGDQLGLMAHVFF